MLEDALASRTWIPFVTCVIPHDTGNRASSNVTSEMSENFSQNQLRSDQGLGSEDALVVGFYLSYLLFSLVYLLSRIWGQLLNITGEATQGVSHWSWGVSIRNANGSANLSAYLSTQPTNLSMRMWGLPDSWAGSSLPASNLETFRPNAEK